MLFFGVDFVCLDKCISKLITHSQNILQELIMCHEMCIFIDVPEEVLSVVFALSMYDDLKFTDYNMNSLTGLGFGFMWIQVLINYFVL